MKLEECFDQYFIWKNRLFTPSSICTCYVGGRKRAEGPCMVGTGFSKSLLLFNFFLQVPRLWEGAPVSSRLMMLIREVLLFLQCCWPPLLLHWMLHPMWGFIQVMEEPFVFFPFPCQGAFLTSWLSSQSSLNSCRKVLCKLFMKT